MHTAGALRADFRRALRTRAGGDVRTPVRLVAVRGGVGVGRVLWAALRSFPGSARGLPLSGDCAFGLAGPGPSPAPFLAFSEPALLPHFLWAPRPPRVRAKSRPRHPRSLPGRHCPRLARRGPLRPPGPPAAARTGHWAPAGGAAPARTSPGSSLYSGC